jgi:hypothetical protein
MYCSGNIEMRVSKKPLDALGLFRYGINIISDA